MTIGKLRASLRAAANFGICSGASMVAIGQSGVALAQESSRTSERSERLEEIIVTARKTSESIMTVPVAAATVSGQELARKGLIDPSDVAAQSPSISFDRTTGGGGAVATVRGIGSSPTDSGVDLSVPMVMDGLQSSRGHFVDIAFLDLAQVEVLKGPQALFFGKNSPGGVLSLTSVGPSDTLQGHVRAGFATGVDESSVEGAIGGPLSNNLRGRIAARYVDTGGWIHNDAGVIDNPFFAPGGGLSPTIGPAPYSKNDSTSLVGRVTVDWKPSDNFSATLRAGYVRNRDNGPAANSEQLCIGTHADTLGVADPFSDCTLNDHQSIGPAPPESLPPNPSDPSYEGGKPYGRFEASTFGLTLDYSAGSVDFTSVTGYMEYQYPRILTNPGVFAYGNLSQNERWHQFSQELRAVTQLEGPINFSGGVYYDTYDMKQYTPNIVFPGLPPDPVTGSFLTYIYNADTSGDSYSAFAQVRWNMTEQLELDLGARYTHDTRKSALMNSFATMFLPIFEPAGIVRSGERDYDNTSPEVTLSWTPVQDTLVYASYRTGYKPGVPASPQTLAVNFDVETALFYDKETVKGYEVGMKSLLLNDTLRLTAAAYTYKYDDLQVSNFNAATFTVEALPGDMDTDGFEIGATYRPIRQLTLNAAFGYNRSRWTHFPGVSCYLGQTLETGCIPGPAGAFQDLTGHDKFRAPEKTGNFGFDYETPVFGGNFLLGFGASMNFSSSYNMQENDSPFAVQDGYEIYNATIRLRTDDDRWEFAVIGKNLSDERYGTYSLDTPLAVAPGTLEINTNRPRQVLFQLIANF